MYTKRKIIFCYYYFLLLFPFIHMNKKIKLTIIWFILTILLSIFPFLPEKIEYSGLMM